MPQEARGDTDVAADHGETRFRAGVPVVAIPTAIL
jgi:hypothetical protein